MKRHLLFLIGLLSIGISLFPWQAEAACRNPNMVRGRYSLRPAAASGGVEIKWFGHSFFQITSSQGTKIITDPFGAMGFPMPEVWPHVVTVGREHGNHNNVG
ncbi:MAG TPA: MBL fold metallo-hydrolase, partial [Thermodesulfobacteriota bacterium]|nr:MBL fold metallo-hydrolase [Thermodesulfobacteriota bacterium]